MVPLKAVANAELGCLWAGLAKINRSALSLCSTADDAVALRTLLNNVEPVVEPLRDITIWMRSLPWTTDKASRWSTHDVPGCKRLNHRSTIGHVSHGVVYSFLVKDIAVYYSCLHKPKHHFPPPLHCFPNETVVHRMLVCQVYTVHVVVVAVYDHWFDSWGACAAGEDSCCCCGSSRRHHDNWLLFLFRQPSQSEGWSALYAAT